MTIIHAEDRFGKKKQHEEVKQEESQPQTIKTSSFSGTSLSEKDKGGFVPFKFIGDLARTTFHRWVVLNPETLPDPFPPDSFEPGPMVA